jgi:hypothetical protein
MDIQYSILMPYHRRHVQLSDTLESFVRFYGDRDDFEVIIVEDLKNAADEVEHQHLLEVYSKYREKLNIMITNTGNADQWNPGPMFNYAASVAKGEYFIVTNPECVHMTDILSGLDKIYKTRIDDPYVVCGCLSSTSTTIEGHDPRKAVWYQHSIHRNVGLHFCSCISKLNFRRIGGFDEGYSAGVCFEDDDFRNSVEVNSIEIIARDSLLVLHLAHNKSKPPNYSSLHRANKIYYEKKWQNWRKAEDIVPK